MTKSLIKLFFTQKIETKSEDKQLAQRPNKNIQQIRALLDIIQDTIDGPEDHPMMETVCKAAGIGVLPPIPTAFDFFVESNAAVYEQYFVPGRTIFILWHGGTHDSPSAFDEFVGLCHKAGDMPKQMQAVISVPRWMAEKMGELIAA